MSTNYINKITDTAGTTHDIQEGVDTRIFRATCTTASGTAAKVATLDDATNYSLAAGVRVAVTFTNGNTAATPTLNVNSGGAKTIVFKTGAGSQVTGNGTTYNTWGDHETIIFTYDGSYWINGGSSLGIYNAYALANSKTSNTGTITSIKTTAGTHTAINVTSGAANFNVPTKTSHLTNDSGFTTNTGTVTKVTAGTGLSIGTTSGGNFTTSGTINHTNSVTAQTTQALYPIKIDAQGHISAYGSAVTSLPASDVSDWAKAATKPTYTASEVGAVPTTRTVNGYALSDDISLTASDVGAAASSAIPTVSTITVNTTTSKGTYVGSSCHQYGRVVTLTFRFRNTSSTASGADIYTGTLSSSLPLPYDTVSSVTYYGAHALVGVLLTDRSLTIRNASNSAVQFGSSNTASLSFTYVCQ